jgi:predicted O-methyltransferase YrrM
MTWNVTGIQQLFGLAPRTRLRLQWIKSGGWLGRHFDGVVPQAPGKRRIEAAAQATNALGAQKLADEYGEPGGRRLPDVVRSSSPCGDLYAWLVQQRRPETVVEFGSAFGISGMYFAAALEAARAGHLYSFEINRDWADIAERNIASISRRFTLTRGAFEDHVDTAVPAGIDLALVDGIHTSDFVMRQFAILKRLVRPGGILVFDDIDFPKPGARMREAWEAIAADADVAAAVEIQGRLGLVELAGAH